MYIGHGGWNCFVCFGFPCSVMAPIRGVTAMLIGRTDSKTVSMLIFIEMGISRQYLVLLTGAGYIYCRSIAYYYAEYIKVYFYDDVYSWDPHLRAGSEAGQDITSTYNTDKCTAVLLLAFLARIAQYHCDYHLQPFHWGQWHTFPE